MGKVSGECGRGEWEEVREDVGKGVRGVGKCERVWGSVR